MEDDPLEKVMLNSGQVIRAHKKAICDPPCAIHAPSNHHMKDWPLVFRDTGALERKCPHGIGHPDPDTIAWVEKHHGKEVAEMENGTHGCDGCCVKKTEAEEDRELVTEYNKGM